MGGCGLQHRVDPLAQDEERGEAGSSHERECEGRLASGQQAGGGCLCVWQL